MMFLTSADWEFQYPWMFALFIPLCLAVLIALFRREPQLRFPSLQRFPKIRHRINSIKIVPLILYALAGSALILALASPRYAEREIKQKFDGVDIMLAIDLSASMEAYDPPENLRTRAAQLQAVESKKLRQRLDICRDAVLRMIDKRPNDRFGLVPFTDQSFVVCPPTLDHTFLKSNVKDLKTHTFGEGTGLASPIAAVLDHMRNSEAKRKIMILVTDGYNTIRNKITPEQAALIAAKRDLVIHTVGIGNNRAFRILYGSYDPFSENYDEKLLKFIAAKTGGRYFAAADEAGLEETLKQIDRLEKTSAELPPIVLYEEISTPLAGLFILLALAAFSLENTLFLRLP